jgi:alkylated DNA nucleotide flippase Atl1
VRRIPPGWVRTYGDVSPGAPRAAGAALRGCGPDVPWWRVVRADGSLALGAEQRARLLDEGVPMRGARIDLDAARLDDLDAV